MKRLLLISILGILLGTLGGLAAFYHQTAPQCAMLCCQNPKLAWLQHEFKMTDDQLAAVQKLDAQYQRGCMEMCDRLSATNELIRAEFTSGAPDSAKMKHLLADAAQLHGECQVRMLEYCQTVSREMVPEQGQRYLRWVCDRVLNMPGNGTMSNSSESGHGN